MEILQGADYEITITLDSATTGKTYVMMVRKDFTGATDFGGRNATSPYRTEIYETDDANYGKLTATDSGTTYTVKVNLHAAWTETLDDDFDGYWEIVEKDSSSYSRIAQGEFYINNSASRLASVTGRSD